MERRRLVTRRGGRTPQQVGDAGPASRTCSKLSSTSSISLSREVILQGLRGSAPGASRTPSAGRSPARRRRNRGSREPTKNTPSRTGRAGRRRPAARGASCRCRRGRSASAAATPSIAAAPTAAISPSRPTKARARGRFFGRAPRDRSAGKSARKPTMTSSNSRSGWSKSLSRCGPRSRTRDARGSIELSTNVRVVS